MTPLSWLMLVFIFIASFQMAQVLWARLTWRPAKKALGLTPQNGFGAAIFLFSALFLFRSQHHLREGDPFTQQAAWVLLICIATVGLFGLVAALNRFTVFPRGFTNGAIVVPWRQVKNYAWNGYRLTVWFHTPLGFAWRSRIRLQPKHFRTWERYLKSSRVHPTPD